MLISFSSKEIRILFHFFYRFPFLAVVETPPVGLPLLIEGSAACNCSCCFLLSSSSLSRALGCILNPYILGTYFSVDVGGLNCGLVCKNR